MKVYVERKEDVEGGRRWRRGMGQEIKEWMKEGGGGGDAKRDKEGKEKTETGCDKVTRRWWSGKGEAGGGGGGGVVVVGGGRGL